MGKGNSEAALLAKALAASREDENIMNLPTAMHATSLIPARYIVNERECAGFFGITKATLRGWVRKGAPLHNHKSVSEAVKWDREPPAPEFDLRKMVRWWRDEQAQSVKRYTEGKTVEQAVLRERIDAEQAIETIQEIDKELETMDADIKAQYAGFVLDQLTAWKEAREAGESTDLVDLLNLNHAISDEKIKQVGVRLGVLKLRQDNAFKKLNKVLPDLKAASLEVNASDPVLEAMEAMSRAAQKK